MDRRIKGPGKKSPNRYQQFNETSYHEFRATELKYADLVGYQQSPAKSSINFMDSFHQQEYLGSRQRVYGGPDMQMDPMLRTSGQNPPVKNLKEPRYVKQREMRRSTITNENSGGVVVHRTSARQMLNQQSAVLTASAKAQSMQYSPSQESVMMQSPSTGPCCHQRMYSDFGRGADAGQFQQRASMTDSKFCNINGRPKSSMAASSQQKRGRAKDRRNNQRNNTARGFELDEIESFTDVPTFGSQAKGMKFGAPKAISSSAQFSQSKRNSKATTATRTVQQTIDWDYDTMDGGGMDGIDGMDGMTMLVFEEDEGPQIAEETMVLNRATASMKATASAKQPMPVQELSMTTNSKLKKKKRGQMSTRRQPVEQSGIGPGDYNLDTPQGQTKSRTRSALMGGIERPDINKRATQASGELGPGAYEGGKKFGKGVVGFSWGKPKTEQMIVDDRDYGISAEKAAKTRYKSPAATISRNVPARGSFVNKAQAEMPDAGMYTKKDEFGKNVTGYSWNKPSIEKREVDNRDYNVDEYKKNRHRSPAAIINANSPARPQTLALQQTCAPGQYDTHKKFGDETKTMSFSRTAREPRKPDMSAGPGEYDLDRAVSATKCNNKAVIISKEKRPETFALKEQSSAGPGHYPTQNEFGKDNKKSFTIGTKSEKKIEQTAGPGEYDIDKSVSATKVKLTGGVFSKEPARPTSLIKEGDVDVAPGQYNDGIRFNSNVKSFRIGEKRTERVPEGMGPGAYSPERAEALTRSKQPNINLGSSPARPTSFLKPGDINVAPGQYNHEKKFGQETKSFRIGEKREKSVEQTAGPGTYEPSKADGLTKHKMPNINMGSSPARPKSLVKSGDLDVAPGQYDDGIRFNSNVKSFRIGEKREQKIENSAGPGTYEPSKADGLTKHKMPNINMGSTPARPKSLVKTGELDVAPGQYDDGIRFNSNVKSFRIGEKRSEKVPEGMGPGEYEPERSEALTKSKQPNINMGSSPARPASFAKPGDENLAPGQYNHEKKFGAETKSFRIGEKRETRTELSAGPGSYEPTKADALTKEKIANINLGSSQARPTSLAKNQDVDVAPGQYDDGIRFNSNSKAFKIGEKRPEKIKEGMGPGAYSPERADALTKHKQPNINLGSSPGRPKSLVKVGDLDVAPGQYNYETKFGEDTKSFRIGEKREVHAEVTQGPGSYDPTKAEALTKSKIPNINMGSSPARPKSLVKAGDLDVAPGQYDDGIRFNSNAKSFRIGEKRPEKVKEGMGPGEYSPERADCLTKQKTPNINLGSSAARPNMAQNQDIDVAPGQYDHEKKFGEETKSFRIGEKREEHVENTAGPGTYEPTRAECLTKGKIPNINMGSSAARPTTLAKHGDIEVAPGQYDDGIRFNSNVKSFRIGEKREEVMQKTAGPGEYSPERAEAITKSKTPNINLGSSPARPKSLAKAGEMDVAPGQYNYETKFGEDTKSFRIGEKREELIQKTAGPGEYEPTRADALTKHNTPNINLGSSPGRPSTLAQNRDMDVAPGQYDDGIRFNSNVKSFRIGEKRHEKVPEGMGPGEYSPERADLLTKHKTPNIDLGSSAARPGSFSQGGDVNVAPGQYNYEKRFGEDTKAFRIGEKQEFTIENTAGPGTYEPTRADTLTKQKIPNINLGSQQARPNSLAQNQNMDTAPGQYDDGIGFNSNKGFRIGEKREERVQKTAGPGEYSPEKADSITKQKIPNINMGSQQARPNSLVKDQELDVAPGQYDDGIGFNSNKGFIIGEKREERVVKTAGPGEYSPERADAVTKQKIPNINLGSQQARPNTLVKDQEMDVAPGQYDDGIRFNSNKGFRIGEKREERVVKTAGPGEYSPERADAVTKQKIPNINMGSQQARPNSFVKDQEMDIAPGQYDDGVGFNSNKGFIIGEKREERVVKTAGPGEYSPERADNITKQKIPNINMGSQQARPNSFVKDQEMDIAPGQYDDGIGFNSNKGFRIGEKREDRVEKTAGPGEYSPERADAVTKQKIPNINMGSQQARPNSLVKDREMDVAPGQYDDGIGFNSNKGFRIGEKREDRVEKTAGPGEYSPEKADNITKQKIPNINMGSQQARPSTLVKDQELDVAPGQYDDGIGFNSNKGFRIGEKREDRVERTAGPGEYSPEKADRITKQKIADVNLGSSPARPGMTVKDKEMNLAPGQYDHERQFGEDTKSFRMGEKREQRIETTAGPGEYSLDRADQLTKQRAQNVNLGTSPARPGTFAVGEKDVDVGPGQYDSTGKNFGNDTKSFRIGEKREKRIDETAGPGTYEPTRAEAVTKSKIQNINMGSAQARPTSLAKSQDADVAPGQYESYKQFGDDIKSFRIGEKREAYIQETAGPGTYEPSRADAMTKQKIQNINLGSSPARPDTFSQIRQNEGAPGQYENQNSFGKDTKSFKIGEKRETRIDQTVGPGTYEPNRADAMTKQKIQNVNLGSSPARPDAFNNQSHDLQNAPGQYANQNSFGKDTKSFKIGEKREMYVEETAGPGAYEPERADRLTRQKSHSQIGMGMQKGRPNTFQAVGDVDIAPGQYNDTSKIFGNNIQGFTIGEKRDSRVELTAGPGQYSPDRADNMTRQKSPTFNMGSSVNRPSTFTGGDSSMEIAPGHYDDGKTATFGFDVKGFTIGEKREHRLEQTAGPGEYNMEQADKLTKTRSPNISLGTSSSRNGPFGQSANTGSFGQVKQQHSPTNNYSDQKSSLLQINERVNQQVQPAQMFEARQDSLSPDRFAEPIQTKTKQQRKKKQHEVASAYKSLMPRNNTLLEPIRQSRQKTTAKKAKAVRPGRGAGDERQSFGGSATKGFTIGVKRDSRVEQSPGPGSYEAYRSDSAIKHKSPAAIDFSRTTGRQDSHSPDGPEMASPERFYNYPKEQPNFSIGVKRPESPRDGPGPGEYNLDDSVTKPRATKGYHKF